MEGDANGCERLPAKHAPTLISACPSRCADAKSDLVNVLSSLEAHWHVLEAEVVEINRDIEYCEQCLRKYGEWFNSPLQYLRVRMRACAQRDPILTTHDPVLLRRS